MISYYPRLKCKKPVQHVFCMYYILYMYYTYKNEAD